MTTILTRWQAAEPVRLYLYGVLLAALALLVGIGVLSAEHAPLWGALGLAVLAVPATEAARARVTPYEPEHRAQLD